MGKLVEVKLGEYRGNIKCDLNAIECERNDLVILEAERGSEFGRVVSDVTKVCEGKTEGAAGKILRRATEGDLKQIENNRMKSHDAINTCTRKINEQKLPMQVIKAEYSFDNSKIIFIFAAEGRVDFRNLVQELARIFRVRIELKQIYVRDKAKIVGGIGVCGRELCCSSYLKSFHTLSISMAKTQTLPLNPSKINGQCGRIKCCMAYEYEVYRELSRSLPRVGQKITTADGKGKVISVNVLRKYVNADFGEGKIVKVSFAEGQEQKAVGVN